MMKFRVGLVLALVVAMSGGGLTGCQTTGESAGLGALIGAGAGALIGASGGNAAEGAIIGAAVGAAAGAITHDVRETRAEKYRTAEATYETYNYEPTVSRGESLNFEDAKLSPSVVRRGKFVEATMQYALLGAGSGKSVSETRLIKRNGELISQVSDKRFTRNDGTWISIQEFRIPESWEPGEYTLEQIVSTSQLTVSGLVKFYVE